MGKRKICVVVHSRANYGRIKSAMQAIKDHPDLILELVVGSSALLDRYGAVINVIREDGFKEDAVLHSTLEGDAPAIMAKSTGLSIVELATHFENLKPDMVLTVADRYETLSTAVAASYMNIPVVHTQGGEVTGSIDEGVRHAITKLSHVHFPATERAKDYVIRMGEDPAKVFFTGCPAIDLVADLDLTLPSDLFIRYGGVGSGLEVDKDYIVVLQHPVTTEFGSGLEQIKATLSAVHTLAKEGMQVAWLWPNVDAGSDDISKGIRSFREHNETPNMHFFLNFEPEDYARLIANTKCIVGNSSSGLREGAFLGVPCVNVGTRQSGREKAANVTDVDYNAAEILEAARKQIAHGKYERDTLVGDGTAGKQMADVLAKVPLDIQKKIHYIND